MTSHIHDWNILLHWLPSDRWSPGSHLLALRVQSFLFVSHLSSLFLIMSNYFAYPRAERRDFGVNTRRLLCPAGMTPGCDPVNHPTPTWTLTHQWTSTVTTATIHTLLRLDAAGAEHAACEGTLEILLAMAAGEKGQRSLLQGLRVWASCKKKKFIIDFEGYE